MNVFKPLHLAPLVLACGLAPAYAQNLPPCNASNYDAARNLFTPDRNNTSLDFDHPIRSQMVNQQCLLTVVSRDQATRLRTADGTRGPGPNGAAELVEGRYVIYLSNGGDGGSGGSARPIGWNGGGGGGGGGGAGAKQVRQDVMLTPGVYKLTLGAGGPGGSACRGTFGGGPGWGGSPTSITRLSDGVTVAGVPGADTWQRPTRYVNEMRSGPADGHGGSGGSTKTAGGAGSSTDPGAPLAAQVAQSGAAPPGVAGKAGDAGGDLVGTNSVRVGGGGGGGAGLGDGGDGGGDLIPVNARSGAVTGPVTISAPEVGGLGAGGGGGAGRTNFCSAGAPGGNGYIALRRG